MDPHARNRRGQGRDLEHGATEPLLELAPHRVRVGDPEHGRKGHALLGREPAGHLARDVAPESGVVEGAREAERVHVGATLGHEVELDPARAHARAGQRVGGQRRVKVLQGPKADDADGRVVAAEVAAGHGLGHHRRGPPHSDRGRQQQVLLHPAGVRVGGERPGRYPLLEPVNGRGHAVRAHQGIGMFGPGLDKRADGVGRALDGLRHVAENVDRARAQVSRADPLGQNEHARPVLGQAHGGGQPGQAGAHHDHVVVAHAAASSSGGRCSTSSRPWKIQSSRRAWRSWSP